MYDSKIGHLVSPSGDKYRKVLKTLAPYEADTEGKCLNPQRFPKVIETGEVVDIQAFINSHLADTRLENILRSLRSGEREVVTFDPDLPVEDLTSLPKTLSEIRSSQALLNKLLPEVEKLKKANTQTVDNVSLTADEIVKLRDFLSKEVK